MTRAAAIARPPRTVADLRGWIDEAMQEGAPVRLGRRTLRVLSSMVDAPGQAAVQSISDIARENGVNASTLTRMAQKLGYAGFAELQDVFRRHVTGGAHFYSRGADRLMQAGSGAASSAALIGEVADSERANLSATLEQLDGRDLDHAVKALTTARQVRILGLRQCFSIAHFFAYGLSLIRNGIAVLGGPGHILPEQMAELDGKSALVLISFAPYTADTVLAGRSARAQGAEVIAISDSSSSPIAVDARPAFVVAGGGPFYFNAMAGSLVLVEALLALAARRLGEKAVAELRRREALFDEFHTEVS